MKQDWNKIRLTLLPHCLRGSQLLNALLGAMLWLLGKLDADRDAYEEKEQRERGYGPRVCELKQAIADQLSDEWVPFDVANVEIVDEEARDLVNVPGEPGCVLLQRAEDGYVPVWREEDIWNRGFVVKLPSSQQTREKEVRMVIERWKGAGSRYMIEWI